ncbi:MAG: hypothetical protein IKG23_03150 [Clostridia bacterium]|nr:hypothetical protein [Clostridia bacterium]
MATNTGILDLVKPAGNENALISVINNNMDKVDAEAGRQRGNIAANYSTSSAYDVGDLCIYQGNLYRCNTAIASGEEWTAAHWTQVNIAGELDSQKQDITSNTTAIANLNSKTAKRVMNTTTVTKNGGTATVNWSEFGNMANNRAYIVLINGANVSWKYAGFLFLGGGSTSIVEVAKTYLSVTVNSTSITVTNTHTDYDQNINIEIIGSL